MANVLDIRRRIRSVRNTRQITKAMKMVSAAKLRRAQERALAARPYAQMLSNVLQSLVKRAEIFDPETGQPRHPLLAQREEQNILLIVVTGDKGLAGAFNTNILKAATRFLVSKQGKNIDVETFGRKGRDFMKRRYPAVPYDAEQQQGESDGGDAARHGPVQVTGEQVGIFNRIEFSQAQELAQDVIERFTRGQVDAVYVVYNEFKSVIAQRLVVERVLPIAEIGKTETQMAEGMSEEDRKRVIEAARTSGVGVRAPETKEMDARAATFATADVDYIYEQDADHMFRDLLPRYVAVQVYRALMESVAAEHAARMTAMDAASSNASDMIDSLTLTMNRVRQASITKEIIEIVSGAASV